MKPYACLRNVLIFCMPATIFMTACTQTATDESFSTALTSAYSVQADMTYGERDTEASCLLTRTVDGVWNAEFSQPASLSGVILTFEENAVSANYKGLSFTVPKSALPAKSMLMLATDVLDSLNEMPSLPCKRTDDNSLELAGESEGGSYTVTFDANGMPVHFSMPNQPLEIALSEFTASE